MFAAQAPLLLNATKPHTEGMDSMVPWAGCRPPALEIIAKPSPCVLFWFIYFTCIKLQREKPNLSFYFFLNKREWDIGLRIYVLKTGIQVYEASDYPGLPESRSILHFPGPVPLP